MVDEYIHDELVSCRSLNFFFSNIEFLRLGNLIRARRLFRNENRSRLVFVPLRQRLSVNDYIYIALAALELLVLGGIGIDVQIVIRYILKPEIDVVRINGCIQAHIDIGRGEGMELPLDNFTYG